MDVDSKIRNDKDPLDILDQLQDLQTSSKIYTYQRMLRKNVSFGKSINKILTIYEL